MPERLRLALASLALVLTTASSSHAALSPTDPVSAAVTSECSTTSVKGLSTQLVEEISCLRPGSMKSLEGAEGLALGSAVFPFLQTAAADALLRARAARGTTMTINSALRTLPQQYLLYRWYQTKRCGISLAAAPGKSNHEGAIAVDIEGADGWRPAMTEAGFRWLGASDPVHFDFTGPGAVALGGLSVTAFQRLWNRNHAEDRIDEDGAYGTETEKRLALAPVGGFAKGAEACADAGAPTELPPAPPPAEIPDAHEPESDEGCSATPGRATRGDLTAVVVALGLLVAIGRARRSSRAGVVSRSRRRVAACHDHALTRRER